jgi:hypothetical protein
MDEPRYERDEVNPNVVWEVAADGSRRRFRPSRGIRSRSAGWRLWLNTKTGETFFGQSPPWLEGKSGQRLLRRATAFTRGLWDRRF